MEIVKEEESKINSKHSKAALVSQGAEGRLYLGDIFGMKCIVKERFVKKYRVPSLDQKLTHQRILQVRPSLHPSSDSRSNAFFHSLGVQEHE
jgi:hypothetical protein